MAIHRHQWVWNFSHPPEDLWPFLSDTGRYNEASGLPKHDIIETPQSDGSVLYEGRAKLGWFNLEWREEPVNWVKNQWFEHNRHFTQGPIKFLGAHLRLEPDGAGSKCTYALEVEAANLVGEFILRTAFFKSTGKTFAAVVKTIGQFVDGAAAAPFEIATPDIGSEARQKVERAIETIEESPHGHGLAKPLADYAVTALEADVVKIRPLELARRWDVLPREAVEVCLEATRVGLLNLRWDILCPRCRVAKSISAGLDEMPTGAHCDTCNIDYDREFSRNVELSFQPAPDIRPLNFGEYCMFGPGSMPHVVAQIAVPSGETRELDANFDHVPFRLRTLEAGPEFDLEYDGSDFPTVILSDEDVSVGDRAAPGTIRLVNGASHDRIFVIEELTWERDALTADRVTALQAFRDLFSDQVLRPGDEVTIQRVALMFTVLRSSPALYEEIVDARAYGLVRDHFALLTQIVRSHDGAVVKTIGDAVMAAFADSATGLAAAIKIQNEVSAFNARHVSAATSDPAITIKIGLHEGPCIAVTLNERLDYFGTTVNMAARLQGESAGDDIVVSQSVARDPAVEPMLAQMQVSEESADLHGFAAPVPFLRLTG
ncbi:MAG: adenylate/guanylate cyclase domain-containing protein [Alphaproteobacteria bacterium]